jgi:hypothetical protein
VTVVPRLDPAAIGVAPTKVLSSAACDLFGLADFCRVVEAGSPTERVGSRLARPGHPRVSFTSAGALLQCS